MNFKANNFNKKILILWIVFIYFAININIINANNANIVNQNKNNIIKVGYPIVNGFTDKKDGEYTGYAYEYLREIGKYTGWEYEIIEMSLNDAMIALKDGKIDIVAGMIKNEESVKIYDFPEYDMGSTYTVLSTLKSNKDINYLNFYKVDKLKVGYYIQSKTRLDSFIKYCNDNKINNIEMIPYDLTEGVLLEDKLKSKEVDAILSGDLLANSDEKVITKFGATPSYFATTKGNVDLISSINFATDKIIENNPDFNQRLYNKYYKNNKDYSFVFTEEEQEYIDNMEPLRAVYISNCIPIEYYDEYSKEAKGISIDYFKLVSARSGIKYKLIKARNFEEAYKMIRENKADVLIGIPGVYSIADKNNMIFTSSYLNLDVSRVVRKEDNDMSKLKTVALFEGYGYSDITKGKNIKYYNTIKECMDAVKNREADLTYANSFAINHYVSEEYYPSLSIITSAFKKELVIGIRK